jgi:GTP pyrophosphokinase
MVLIGTVDAHPENDLSPLVAPIRRERKSVTGIDVEGADDVLVKLARCCAPVPGDLITGFITRGSGVSVHRSDCINLNDLRIHQGDRIVVVKWNNSAKSTFLVNIQVEALDRARLLSDVTKALSDQHVNILSASVVTNKDQTAISRFLFEMADASHLDTVLTAVRSVEGVYDVNRVFNN